jgi:putative ABC transport system permease protein
VSERSKLRPLTSADEETSGGGIGAVWRASRGAVRRRRLQTIVIGIVVGLSTAMSVVALGLLAASSGPFDQAHTKQSGAHVVAAFDPAKASAADLAKAAQQPGVEAVAGPFGAATVKATFDEGGPPLSLTVVGRADPGGEVDRLNVWKGRWASRPGEVVLNQNPVSGPNLSGGFIPGNELLGTEINVSGGPSLTVVGLAFTVSESAAGWVTPEQMTALNPSTNQMLYRFSQAATDSQVRSGLAAVTSGLPSGALVGSQSYLTLRAIAAAEPGTFVPFLAVFGCLGLAVAVLIVANVVSGAVVAGFRHIGVLKALGFTPTQVMTVYLAMVSIPAIAGCLVGAVLGNLLATPLLNNAFAKYGAGGVGVALWVDIVVLLGIPLVVALSAMVPALRARSLSATEAISAGSAQHAGRALWIQRWLSGTRLPRSISLGLGLPFARPARSALTMAAIVLGVASVTFAIGLGKSVIAYQDADTKSGQHEVDVLVPPDTSLPAGGSTVEALLRSLPGTANAYGSVTLFMQRAGTTQDANVKFYQGDATGLGYRILNGRWLDGPGQVVASERFLTQSGLTVGDTLDLEEGGKRTQVQIVGQLLNTSRLLLSNWETLARLAPETPVDRYEVQLTPATDAQKYLSDLRAANPRLAAEADDRGTDEFVVIMFTTITLLTLMLGSVAALGVFNTVVLNARERRRDLGMLKSIGMTPRQVTMMMVTSMAALGAFSGLLGLPIGIVTHRLVLPIMMRAAQIGTPNFILHVYPPLLLLLLALAGVAIAALGALLPARSAARTTIAEVLRSE